MRFISGARNVKAELELSTDTVLKRDKRGCLLRKTVSEGLVTHGHNVEGTVIQLSHTELFYSVLFTLMAKQQDERSPGQTNP